MTFEEFKEINKKYGLSRMWIDEYELKAIQQQLKELGWI